MQAKNYVWVALDVDSIAKAGDLITSLAQYVGGFKVGLELISAEGGPQVVSYVRERGGSVFYDGKFHDIPNTVAGAVRVVARQQGIAIVNVHCLGGAKMMVAAAQAAREVEASTGNRPSILGVTILTSVDYDEAVRLNLLPNNVTDPQLKKDLVAALVRTLSLLALDSGLDGAICSPQETGLVREACGSKFQIVNPGIRPAGAAVHDQARPGTPTKAVRDGATGIVVGRPITEAPDPVAAAIAIAAEIEAAQAA